MAQENKIKKNKELCKKYPFLLPRNVFSDKVPDDYDYSYTELDAIEDGWRIAFGDFLIEELRVALAKTNNLKTFRFDQIKEKWGRFTAYTHGGNDETENIIQKYSILSKNICMKCGKPDVFMTNKSWIYPCCKECWETNKYNTNIPYEDYIEGNNAMSDIMVYRTYSPEYDSFEEQEIDISDTAHKIRETWWRKYDDENERI